MKNRKRSFELPYIAIEQSAGISVLYGAFGDFSAGIEVTNLAVQHGADPAGYETYQQALLNLIKVLGEGYLLQKQDVFLRKQFAASASSGFLQGEYQAHFLGRDYTEIRSFLFITRKVKRGRFYVHNKKQYQDFLDNVLKSLDLLKGAGLLPRLLGKAELDGHIKRMLAMDFSSPHFSLCNLRCGDREIEAGERKIRCISLIDTGSIDLPEKLGCYQERSDGQAMQRFAMDNLGFLFQVPGYSAMVYNQLLEIPSQQQTLGKLELKRKRHSGIPDPANLMCVEDIDQLLVDVARENQLLIHAHYNIVLCADSDKLSTAANFIESSLFEQGIIPSNNAYNQLELFRSALPGNGVELKSYDWFLTTADAALCLFFKERLLTGEPSDFLIHFTDRQGIPIGIDPADLPMSTGRINNRNKFVLGPSGSGKSFFMNALVEQYLSYNMDVVIIDTGHSYAGLCKYFGGKYQTYSEQRPITMNPFLISREEYNLEKKDFLKTLVSLLLKGADGAVSQVEDAVISNVISSYYSSYFLGEGNIVGLCFDSFYDFSVVKIDEIRRTERISFDLDEYRYVLRKFYSGGEYGSTLNEQADTSLFSEPLIIFEIDAIRENKVLFPIVTLIIMDVFLQKMRNRPDRRKTLICEESWKAIASPIMASYLMYMYKTVRKFWGEAIVVTQELGDIISNPIVKDSIINNSDTVCLLDQSNFREKYEDIAKLLSLSAAEQQKIFTINKLDNKAGRGKFKEVYIKRGNSGEVYGVEVSMSQYFCFSTEKPEKNALEFYVSKFGNYPDALRAIVSDFKASGKSLQAFVAGVNSQIKNH